MSRRAFLASVAAGAGGLALAAGSPGTAFASPSARAAASAPASAAVGQKLFYGINGHPLQPGIYQQISQATQIGYLNDLGMTVYRCDIGDAGSADVLAGWAAACASSGIQLLPTLTPTFDLSDPTASYASGHALGAAVASACAPYCDVYECGNEIDTASGVRLPGDGSHLTDYDQNGFVAAREVIRGMIEGVKSVQPTARAVSNGCATLDITFTDMLFDGQTPNGSTGGTPVVWDATGWHWYESSGDITNGGTWLNVPAYLHNTYGKPIWLTEYGANAGADTPEQQASYLGEVLQEYYGFRSTYDVECICLYELISMPSDGADFGLFQQDGVTEQPAYATVKSFIAANPV